MGLVRYIIALLLILIPATSLAAVYNASDCEYANVKSAVALATNAGDIVNVPAGACDWGTSYVTITKAIKLVGAGTSDTTGTRISVQGNPYSFGNIRFNTGTTAAEFPFEMTGFRIIGNDAATAKNIVQVTGAGSGWRIHGNYFYRADTAEPSNAVLNILATSATGQAYNMFGLIDDNIFYNVKIYMTAGSAATAETSWAAAAQWGTDQATFVENNTFYGSSPVKGSRLDSWGGSRMVIRYNDWHDTRVEAHAACQATVRGARSYELYNNKFAGATSTSGQAFYLSLRAGSHVVTKNFIGTVTNSYHETGKVGIDNRRAWFDSACTSGFGNADGTSAKSLAYDTFDASPAHPGTAEGLNLIPLDGIGIGTGATGHQTQDPVYIWNNVSGKICVGGTNKYGICTTDGDCPSSTCSTQVTTPDLVYRRTDSNNMPYLIVADRDYFEETARPDWTAYTCPHPLADPSAQGSCATDAYGTTGYTLTGGGDDETAPTVLSVYVNGATMTINFDEPITSADNAGFTLDPSGADVTVDCPAVATAASSMACTISRALVQSETATYAYTDTKVVDTAGTPNALANIGATAITGNLTPAEAPTSKLTVSKTGSGCTVTSSPSGISLGGATASDDFEFNTGTVVTLSGWSENGWNAITYGGDCAANGTVTMSAAKECTATCTQVQLFP